MSVDMPPGFHAFRTKKLLAKICLLVEIMFALINMKNPIFLRLIGLTMCTTVIK